MTNKTNERIDGDGDEVVGWVQAAACARRSVPFLRRLAQHGKLKSRLNERREHTFNRRFLEALRPTDRPPAAAQVVPVDAPEATTGGIIVPPAPPAAPPLAPTPPPPLASGPPEPVDVDVAAAAPDADHDLQAQIDDLRRQMDALLTATKGWAGRVNSRVASVEGRVEAAEQRLQRVLDELRQRIDDVRGEAVVRADLPVIVQTIVQTIVQQLLPLLLADGLEIRQSISHLAAWLRIPWFPPQPTPRIGTGPTNVTPPSPAVAPPVGDASAT